MGQSKRSPAWEFQGSIVKMNYSLNSLKAGSIGGYMGDHYWAIMGDTMSLDYS